MTYSFTLTWDHLLWTGGSLVAVTTFMIVRRVIKDRIQENRDKEIAREKAREDKKKAREDKNRAYDDMVKSIPKTWRPLYDLVTDMCKMCDSIDDYEVMFNYEVPVGPRLVHIINAYVSNATTGLDPMPYYLYSMLMGLSGNDPSVGYSLAPYVVSHCLAEKNQG